MPPLEKQQRLRKFKAVATGLFLLMAVLFTVTFFLPETLLTGYLRAFSEAAMVGGLADWFAVTALFRRPLGLPIPHTNLIETNKDSIGNSLGHFISENFLNAENIRPRIEKLHIANRVGDWLLKKANRDLLIGEVTRMASEALEQIKDEEMELLIDRQMRHLITRINAGKIAGDVLSGILNQGLHEEWMTLLAENATRYIEENKHLVREKVREESYFLIPEFVDNLIAAKITNGLQGFLSELAHDPHHPQRQQITQRLYRLSEEMKTGANWEQRFQYLKDNLLTPNQTKVYSGQLWHYLKEYLSENLSKKDSEIHRYLDKALTDIAHTYLHHGEKSRQLDGFVQVQVFKLIMRHREDVARLIHTTVSNWESKSLSRKLELEVGKDLQFIRLNGTLVGGLVGIIIYTISRLF